MIRAVIVINTQGKPRITKFYDPQPVEKQQELIRDIFGVLCSRAENVSNFVQADAIFGPIHCENELAILDLIQVFVETLDKCFKNVCELDIVFNFNKLHTVLDEIIMGGQVVETNSAEVMKTVQEILKLERSSETSLIGKASGRQGR